MTKFPIPASVVLNIHREAAFLRRTLLSLAEAAKYARSKGTCLELVAVLDRTDDQPRQVLTSFDLSPYQNTRIIEVDNGSLGLSRNDGINHSSGEFIFTADADDLVSYNYFHAILEQARSKGKNSLYFPEAVLSFGDPPWITLYRGSDAVPPKAFVDGQPYISRVCAHKDVFLSIPYRDVRLQKGYAYEDWHFNAEAVALGVGIHTVHGTVLFYRQRPGSLLKSADAMSGRQIPPTRLFEPETFLKLSRHYEQERATGAERTRSPVPPTTRWSIHDPGIRDFIAQANVIEPSISAEKYAACPISRNFEQDYPLGTANLDLCSLVRDRDFSDVFLLPFMPRGGAEKYFVSLMEAMY